MGNPAVFPRSNPIPRPWRSTRPERYRLTSSGTWRPCCLPTKQGQVGQDTLPEVLGTSGYRTMLPFIPGMACFPPTNFLTPIHPQDPAHLLSTLHLLLATLFPFWAHIWGNDQPILSFPLGSATAGHRAGALRGLPFSSPRPRPNSGNTEMMESLSQRLPPSGKAIVTAASRGAA